MTQSSHQQQGSTGSPPREGGGWHDAIDECPALGDAIVSPAILGAAEDRCDRFSHHRRLLVSLCLGGSITEPRTTTLSGVNATGHISASICVICGLSSGRVAYQKRARAGARARPACDSGRWSICVICVICGRLAYAEITGGAHGTNGDRVWESYGPDHPR